MSDDVMPCAGFMLKPAFVETITKSTVNVLTLREDAHASAAAELPQATAYYHSCRSLQSHTN